MSAALDVFHFLRPLWLLALPTLAWLWWWTRTGPVDDPAPTGLIAPHLALALEQGRPRAARLRPLDAVFALAALLALAVAGPSWSRLPNPLIAETAPLIVALKLTPEMEAPISGTTPSRLARARLKLTDLVSTRVGAPTGLIAYAGTAHAVAPPTEDPDILRPLLDGLSPDVMPRPGDSPEAALTLAADMLAPLETPGATLLVLDRPPGALPPAERPVICLVVAASLEGGSCPNGTVLIAPDDRDIDRITRDLRRIQAAALAGDDRLDWRDQGPWLAWPAALLALIWFRRGWTMNWAGRQLGRFALLLALMPALPAEAQEASRTWRDLFLTPDQQGMIAYRKKSFSEAADHFTDPAWRGQALLKAGRYPEAANLFASMDSYDAAMGEGLARIRNREYRPAIAAYETALTRRPGDALAQRNLDVARAILQFVEDTRAASDTSEEAGIGADDTVYDNDAARGVDTTVQKDDAPPQALSTDQWLDSIDTDMTAFLRTRFRIDLTRTGQE